MSYTEHLFVKSQVPESWLISENAQKFILKGMKLKQQSFVAKIIQFVNFNIMGWKNNILSIYSNIFKEPVK